MTLARYILPLLLAAAASIGKAASAGVWIDVPYFRQSPEGCGSASIAMVLEYWRGHGAAIPVVDEPAIFRQLYKREPNRPGGISGAAMTAYMKSAGFDAFAFTGAWADLEKHIAQGRPLIVAFDGGTQLHYAVVAGVSDSTISLNDPADRKLRQYNRADFEQKWSASQRWMLLAVPTNIR